MPRKVRSALELASGIGSLTFDLYHHGDREADKAFALLVTVNPEVFAWLRDRLIAATTPATSREEVSTKQGPVTPSVGDTPT